VAKFEHREFHRFGTVHQKPLLILSQYIDAGCANRLVARENCSPGERASQEWVHAGSIAAANAAAEISQSTHGWLFPHAPHWLDGSGDVWRRRRDFDAL